MISLTCSWRTTRVSTGCEINQGANKKLPFPNSCMALKFNCMQVKTCGLFQQNLHENKFFLIWLLCFGLLRISVLFMCLLYTWLCGLQINCCAEILFHSVILFLCLGNWSFQVGRRFLLHEGGGLSPWLWLGIFRKLRWCCHACHPLVGELCKYHKH